MQKRKIIIKRKPSKKVLLKELLDKIDKNNLHREIDFGKPAGREFILLGSDQLKSLD